MPGKDKRQLAEERYLSEDISLKALAEEVDVKYQTLRGWCRAGEWMKKRQNVQRQAVKKAAEKAVNKKARELCKLLEASDEMESALLLAAKAIARNLGDDPEGLMVTDGRERAGNLTRIVQAIGRQAETRMMLSGILTEAEREKLDLLRRKQELNEQKAAQGTQNGESVKVEMTPEAQTLSE